MTDMSMKTGQVEEGTHIFYEVEVSGGKSKAWHRYPDGSLVGPMPVGRHYAQHWADLYNRLGAKALTVYGEPE